jgi:XTP/dITP diphosphohydrolase
VRSARYAGENASDSENRTLLLRELAPLRKPGMRFSARFICVLVVAKEGRVIGTFEGTVEGEIAPGEKGEAGFGYDPVFIPQGEEKTFAELPPEFKNRISHRAKALQQFQAWIQTLA